MIKGKEYYYICKEVRKSIKKGLHLNRVNLTPFAAGEIAGFLTCDDCLGDDPEVENFFNRTSPKLGEYRFKKRKKLQAWLDRQIVIERPFAKMANNWWAGKAPQLGARVFHCDECQEAPVVFVLDFELNPLDVMELAEAEARGEDVPGPDEAPEFFLLCGACYETVDPEEILEETLETEFDEEMQQDLAQKVLCHMDYDTYQERFEQRNAPSAPEIGDVVACCDHMIEEPEFPLHYWYVEPAGMEIDTVEGKHPQTEPVSWLQCCNLCDNQYSSPLAILDNSCKEDFYIIWKKSDYETFPILPPDAEDDTTEGD